ncbi:hypothetical protein LZA78_02255 [Sinirhodobacter sp. WL0062]|uniref:MFS transporter n=1 Tax=Rhodobacter flavimaris TaxID=2907145 RepID=A0ABS8YQZ8_9RHOB|nr:hypothetical protein [Sinirhodobacter sp. WL0062]MCE5972314.1 hypothetical protein [Sinirhodobacter sp. WL0062]
MSVSTTTFAERLKRIEEGRENAKGNIILHVGDNEMRVRSLEEVRRPSRVRELLQGALYSLNLVWAFLIGLFAVAFVVALQAHMFTLPQTASEMFGDGQIILSMALGTSFAYVLRWILRLRGRSLNVVQLVAVGFAVCSLHNLAFWMPELSAVLFTPKWVEMYQASAAPDTFVFRGTVIGFGV